MAHRLQAAVDDPKLFFRLIHQRLGLRIQRGGQRGRSFRARVDECEHLLVEVGVVTRLCSHGLFPLSIVEGRAFVHVSVQALLTEIETSRAAI